MLNGKSINSSENYSKKIEDYIKKDNDSGKLNILVCDIIE